MSVKVRVSVPKSFDRILKTSKFMRPEIVIFLGLIFDN
jgi:hypothetical protein